MADYASATPANFIGDGFRFWQGQNFITPENAWYDGVIVRARVNPVRVTVLMITDGLSNTMVVGEKWVSNQTYQVPTPSDDCGWADGWDPDVIRFTMYAPRSDVDPSGNGWSFGNAHPGGVNAVFGDGSVRTIRYDISPELFNRLGHRADGQVVVLE